MRLPIYQVDAFTDKLFGGNPAAICPLETWLPDATMQAVAAENNLSETAFLVREGDEYALRWFTPSVEVDLCGHATLASAHVVFSCLEPQRESVRFRTLKAGTLVVSRRSGMLTMDFPARPAAPCEAPAGLLAALGGTPREALCARDHLVVYGSAAEIAAHGFGRARAGRLLGRDRHRAGRGRRGLCFAFLCSGPGRAGGSGDRLGPHHARALLGETPG